MCSPRPAALEGREDERRGGRFRNRGVAAPGVGLLPLPRAARRAARADSLGGMPRLGDGGTAAETVGDTGTLTDGGGLRK